MKYQGYSCVPARICQYLSICKTCRPILCPLDWTQLAVAIYPEAVFVDPIVYCSWVSFSFSFAKVKYQLPCLLRCRGKELT